MNFFDFIYMKYRIILPIKKASGFQSWIVEAMSKREALQKFNMGKGQFEKEFIEAVGLGKPKVEKI